MNRLRTYKNQTGVTMLPIALTVALIGVIMIMAMPIAREAQQRTFRMATIAGINELANAAKFFYVTPANGHSWPASPEVLISGNYLAGFENRNGFGDPYTFDIVGSTLQISTDLPDAGQALEVATAFGGMATTTDNRVTVSWSRPGTESAHEELVHRDGSRDVYGKIIHRPGGSAGLVLNDNDIESVGRINSSATIRARNASDTGLIDADNGAIDILTVNDIRITP